MINRKRQRIRSRRPRRGVTLIELIVASTILMLGLLSIVGVSAMVSRSLGESRNMNLAATYAQSRFEKLAGQACSTFSLGAVTEETTRGITGAHIENMSVRVQDGKIVEYKVNLNVAFGIERTRQP